MQLTNIYLHFYCKFFCFQFAYVSVARTRRKRVKYFTEECDDDESCDAIRDLTARDKGLASGKGGDPLRRSHKKKGKNGFKSFGRPEKGKLATGSPIVSPPKDAWRPKCPKCGRRFSSPLAFQYHDIRFVILLPVFQHFDIFINKTRSNDQCCGTDIIYFWLYLCPLF